MVKTWPIPFFYLAPICLPIMNVGMRNTVPQRSGTFSCILATSGYASKLGPKTWFEKNTTLPAEMWSNLIRRVNNISISQAKYYIYICMYSIHSVYIYIHSIYIYKTPSPKNGKFVCGSLSLQFFHRYPNHLIHHKARRINLRHWQRQLRCSFQTLNEQCSRPMSYYVILLNTAWSGWLIGTEFGPRRVPQVTGYLHALELWVSDVSRTWKL